MIMECLVVRGVLQAHIGEMAALLAAICFALNAIVFESAAKSVGSMAVNYIRILIAFILLSIVSLLTRGIAFPFDATGPAWFWLILSGLLGLVLGDMFLFQAFVELGSRIALLIMSAAPPLTALMGFLLLGEKITFLGLLGITVTMLGISLVILSKKPEEKKVEFNRPLKGLVFASLGAIGQASGLVFSKLGVGRYNVFAATQIRMIAAAIGLTIIITVRKQWPEIRESFGHKKALGEIAVGSVLGPFIGVTASILAVQYTATGIVSSISSIAPVVIIPFSIMVFKEKVLPKEVVGAVISIMGIVILFL